jgi:hypothetical protein
MSLQITQIKRLKALRYLAWSVTLAVIHFGSDAITFPENTSSVRALLSCAVSDASELELIGSYPLEVCSFEHLRGILPVSR